MSKKSTPHPIINGKPSFQYSDPVSLAPSLRSSKKIDHLPKHRRLLEMRGRDKGWKLVNLRRTWVDGLASTMRPAGAKGLKMAPNSLICQQIVSGLITNYLLRPVYQVSGRQDNWASKFRFDNQVRKIVLHGTGYQQLLWT